MPKILKGEGEKKRGQARSKKEYYHEIYGVKIKDKEPPEFILGNGDSLVLRFQGDASGAICAAYWEVIPKNITFPTP